jgi:hypothetical protein
VNQHYRALPITQARDRKATAVGTDEINYRVCFAMRNNTQSVVQTITQPSKAATGNNQTGRLLVRGARIAGRGIITGSGNNEIQ